MPATRRLAAILAADVVGYSWLMGEDEAGTAQALSDYRIAADPLVAEHGGRIVKTTGDGVLIEFGSVVGAVECALALQQLAAERNEGIPGERRMEWRIGGIGRRQGPESRPGITRGAAANGNIAERPKQGHTCDRISPRRPTRSIGSALPRDADRHSRDRSRPDAGTSPLFVCARRPARNSSHAGTTSRGKSGLRLARRPSARGAEP